MGYAKWSTSTYNQYRAQYAGRSRDDIFQNNRNGQISEALNPYGLTFRESRDSVAHPNALAIGIFLDVTGSMGRIPELLIRHKLGTMMDTLLQHGVTDPQVMFSAIGDQYTDRAPLQVGQFESGATEMNLNLSQLYLEGGGGGQAKESYQLAWLIAGYHTAIDCYEKRGQKGFLFTVGDEMSWDLLDANYLRQLMGYSEGRSYTTQALLRKAQEQYQVYHIHINETGYRNSPAVLQYWRDLLGENFLVLDDHRVLAELIASVIASQQGANMDQLTQSFDVNTAQQLQQSLKDLPGASKKTPQMKFDGWFSR